MEADSVLMSDSLEMKEYCIFLQKKYFLDLDNFCYKITV